MSITSHIRQFRFRLYHAILICAILAAITIIPDISDPSLLLSTKIPQLIPLSAAILAFGAYDEYGYMKSQKEEPK